MDDATLSASSVLIIDDEPRLLEDYKSLLEESGIPCLTAEDGESGLEQAKEHRPGLIILDLMLPKVDGLTVLKELKGDPDLTDIPVLVLSALPGDTEKKASLQLGAVEYLEKVEIEPSQLLHKIKKLLPHHA